jgi:uncharacterized membrane protein
MVLMRLLFLAPLLTGLISGYVARRSQDEMAYLTGAVACISVLISLMLAPWQVQLLLLVFIVSTIKYVWKRKDITEEAFAVQQFQSTVRDQVNLMGNRKAAEVVSGSIAVTPPEAIDKKKVRKYRGVLIDETPSQAASTPSNLKYRGANVDSPKQ